MKYSRTLNLRFTGEKKLISPEVNEPERTDNKQWRCGLRCDGIHPKTSYVYGEDEIGSLYDCLNCIGTFFREMEKLGYSVWSRLPGDFGGFTFGMRIEDIEEANNDPENREPK
jgi:hypothetical protein